MIFKGDVKEAVAQLVEALKKDGHDFTVGIPIDTPISEAERVVSVGKGIGDQKNMKLIEELARQAGAAIGSSRPVAEELRYVPIERYVGMSGQTFRGNLYIACGISVPVSISRASRKRRRSSPSIITRMPPSSRMRIMASSAIWKTCCRCWQKR
ncbi:MAG: FAD-binding protein [Merdibacter sp.]